MERSLMDKLMTRRRALQTVSTVGLTLAFAPTVSAADSETTADGQPISVNGQAVRGYWASQRPDQGKSGGQ